MIRRDFPLGKPRLVPARPQIQIQPAALEPERVEAEAARGFELANESTALARVEFEMACWIPRISLRRISDTIKPAGSSAARLMRKPVANRSRRRSRSAWLTSRR